MEGPNDTRESQWEEVSPKAYCPICSPLLEIITRCQGTEHVQYFITLYPMSHFVKVVLVVFPKASSGESTNLVFVYFKDRARFKAAASLYC